MNTKSTRKYIQHSSTIMMGINDSVGGKHSGILSYVPAFSVPATVKFCWIQVPIQFSIVRLARLAVMAVERIRP